MRSVTVAEVREHWVVPPPEYGPDVYYGLNGPITIDVVRRDLDAMQTLGYRAVTVQYGFGWDLEYLSPAYLEFFKQFVFEAKKRGMRIWIVDDAGYPSGFAGGRFTAEHPELGMQALVSSSQTALKFGETFHQTVSQDVVAVTAISGSGQSVSISFASGVAHWTAPAGQWKVFVVEHAFRTSPTRSDTNPKRVKDGTQSLEDYLDPIATAQYLQFTHEAYKSVVGDEFGKTILGFRGDEPDYSISGLPWTTQFFEIFQRVKGYDIRPYVATFLQQRDATLTPEQVLARADYYDVFADLFRDGFFKPQGEWCAANGLEYQVHLNHEEMEIALAHSEGDFFRDMKYVEVPGIDSIWHQIWTDTISDFPRLASSAAHVYGHPRAFTESFAAYRPLPNLEEARYILNEQFVRGINLIETMYFPATSLPGRGGPAQFMRDPAYPSLMRYTGRMSYLMSMGQPAAEVALLLPSTSLWMGDKAADDTFVSTERLLSEHQIDFDIVGEDAIGAELRADRGTFISASGNHYRTVLVPREKVLPEKVYRRLREFAEGGGHVVFLAKAPSMIGAKSDLEARPAATDDFDWAKVISAELPTTPTPPAQPPTSPPSPIVLPADLLTDVLAAVPASALTLRTPNTSLRFAHRELRDAAVFLLFNESSSELNDDLYLRVAGKQVGRWNPETGEIRPFNQARREGGRLKLPLSMAPYSTDVLVVQR